MSDFITIKVYAERTAFGPLGRPYTTTTNEVEEIIVPISRIVQVIPKNEIKCLVDIDSPDGVDTRWCVMSAAEVMSLISSATTHDDDTCPHLVRANLLSAENARLKAEVERLRAFTTRTIVPNEELQKQVERLTKAGDAMAFIMAHQKDSEFNGFIEDWNAAKEGKQP
ncbi:MAG: hypothetical protein RLZ85_426 [Verrucomicrobiota bacterium]|jgi:hypothetical protein